MIPVSISGWGSAGSSLTTPRRRASGSNVVPWIRVEVTTTKKIALKISCPSPTPATTGKVASQIGIAPRRPAQPSISRSRVVERRQRAGDERRQRAGDEDQRRREQQPLAGDVAEPAGEDQQPEQGEERDLATHARPWWKAIVVWRGGHRPGAEDQGGDVDGEEPGPVDELGDAVGERRRWRSTRPGRARGSAGRGCGSTIGREPDRDAEGEPDRELEARPETMSARP